MGKHELKEYFEQRFQIYHLLQHFYQAAPTIEFAQRLADLGEGIIADSEGLSLILNDLVEVNEGLLGNIRWDYTRLFVGPAKLPAPPYESVYCSPQKLVMQETTAEVRKYYLDAGLAVREKGEIPDDHIAIELEFMKSLCAMALSAFEAGSSNEVVNILAVQRKFMEEHLLTWVPRFSEDVQSFAQTSFYRGVAILTLEFINNDFKAVEELTEGLELTKQ